MEAVHEMLLQSWGDCLRIFPSVSRQWADAEFENLRAQGGFIVSAVRRKGQTVRVRIEATVDGPLRLREPFPGRTAIWNLEGVRREGGDYVINMLPGLILEGVCPAG